MPGTFIDINSPRHRLPFDQLPRGFMRFPDELKKHVECERAKHPPENFTDEVARRTLEQSTLVYLYEGIPVAYRSAPDGIEVLALGFEEVAAYRGSEDKGIKVVQP
jgi:hypothetical protein